MLCRRISMTSRVLLLLLTLGYDENSSDAGKTTVLCRPWISAKNLPLTIGDCVSLVNRRITLTSVTSQFGTYKRTTEDDKSPGSDLPQCQHRNVALGQLKQLWRML